MHRCVKSPAVSPKRIVGCWCALVSPGHGGFLADRLGAGEDAVRLDLYFVENWSLAGDLVILWLTARAVLGSHGAY